MIIISYISQIFSETYTKIYHNYNVFIFFKSFNGKLKISHKLLLTYLSLVSHDTLTVELFIDICVHFGGNLPKLAR